MDQKFPWWNCVQADVGEGACVDTEAQNSMLHAIIYFFPALNYLTTFKRKVHSFYI